MKIRLKPKRSHMANVSARSEQTRPLSLSAMLSALSIRIASARLHDQCAAGMDRGGHSRAAERYLPSSGARTSDLAVSTRERLIDKLYRIGEAKGAALFRQLSRLRWHAEAPECGYEYPSFRRFASGHALLCSSHDYFARRTGGKYEAIDWRASFDYFFRCTCSDQLPQGSVWKHVLF
jgi:hypothetical protein